MNKIIFTQILVLMSLCFSFTGILFTQNLKTVNTKPSYYNLNSDGDQSSMKLSQNLPQEKEFSPEKNKLLAELQTAREENNIQLSEAILHRLNEIDGVTSVQQPNDPRGTFQLNEEGQNDYNTAQINNIFAGWANAVATVPIGVPNGGRLWVASTQYHGPNASDSIKFYYSDNNGASWNYFGQLYFNFDLDFVNDELDIEAVYDGTSVWLYGVTGMFDYTDGRYKCMVFRFKSDGTGVYTSIINYPGYSSAANLYYNPRICTDNTNYFASAFAYIICSQDSLASTHHIKQQYVYLTSIFAATPTFNFKNPSGSGGFFWNYPGTANRIYLYGDIGYYYDAGVTNHDRIMTLFSAAPSGYTDMYLAWTDDYGGTIAGNLILGEIQRSTDARIGFNGGQNRSGMIVYRANYNNTPDWDIVYRNTTTGGTTAASWNSGYIDFTSNIAKSSDVIAVRNGTNLFKAAYSQMNGSVPYAYYSGFNGSSWSAPIQVSNVQTDTNWRKPRAGYINGGGDDCITIWSSYPVAGTYDSRLCTSTVGINNNETPVTYSLSQNYPNPFNPTTTIKFSLPNTAAVKLAVYDAAGKVIAELINKTMAQGTYNVDFDALKLSSGVYFYKLETPSFSEVKKMVLIK